MPDNGTSRVWPYDPLRSIVMTALAVVSALATLVPTVLSGYFRYRAPTYNAGIVLFVVAIVSGLMFVGVRSGLWGVLIPQLALDGAAAVWGVKRLRAIGVND